MNDKLKQYHDLSAKGNECLEENLVILDKIIEDPSTETENLIKFEKLRVKADEYFEQARQIMSEFIEDQKKSGTLEGKLARR